MFTPVITATGLFTPENTISNSELVASYNQFVEQYNQQNAKSIESGEIQALQPSSEAFIEKASGIKSRYVLQKENILNPQVMSPKLPVKDDEEPCYMAEMAVKAAKEAFAKANLDAQEIDLVIVAASNMERAYPAIAVEVQTLLGCSGYAFDMNVACSSATFGIKTASDAIKSGTARKVLMVNPEICSGHLNFRDRDCHFIFGDVCTAVVLERQEDIGDKQLNAFLVEDCHLITQFSNNIRNNFGFLNRESASPGDLLFKQQGRKVFKEVVPMVAELIGQLLDANQMSPQEVKRFWLHQANLNMNQLIIKKLLGAPPNDLTAPTVLDEYANTSSAGSVIAFHRFQQSLQKNDVGVLCSFGAGYSAGAILLRKVG